MKVQKWVRGKRLPGPWVCRRCGADEDASGSTCLECGDIDMCSGCGTCPECNGEVPWVKIPSDPMAKMGRPRSVAGEDDEDRSTNAVVRLGERHRAELEALIADGHGPTKSHAVRYLIEQSAKRRAKRR